MKLDYDQQALITVCRERGVSKLELFGSVLGASFRDDSDIDVLCTLRPEARCTLLGWADLQFLLEGIFGRRVDLVSRWAVERSKNSCRRDSIPGNVSAIYLG